MRYFLELSYNGKNYHGWQIQPNAITVQEVIETTMSTLMRKEIKVAGAGRTDTGVHARQMFAHFDVQQNLNSDFTQRLNQFLPNDIAIHNLAQVTPEAHARFDAVSRTYEYLISVNKNPFLIDWTWQRTNIALDLSKMNQAAELLLHYSDFTSFAKLHSDAKTNICNVTDCYFVKENNMIKFNITADRFLRNMVRSIVGTLIDVGRNKLSKEGFKQIVEQKNRNAAGVSAPAKGLYLVKVAYPNQIFL